MQNRLSQIIHSLLLSGAVAWNHCQKSISTWLEGYSLKICFGNQDSQYTFKIRLVIYAAHFLNGASSLFVCLFFSRNAKLNTCWCHFCGWFIMGKAGCLTQSTMLWYPSRELYGLSTICRVVKRLNLYPSFTCTLSKNRALENETVSKNLDDVIFAYTHYMPENAIKTCCRK